MNFVLFFFQQLQDEHVERVSLHPDTSACDPTCYFILFNVDCYDLQRVVLSRRRPGLYSRLFPFRMAERIHSGYN